jgi:hypothetical protein
VGWVRFENTTPENPKVSRVSDRAFRLWFNASCYCSRGETDGKIPREMLPGLVPGGSRKVTAELLEIGLLEEIPSGYLVHDYLEYNPSRERISEFREMGRKRQKKHRGSSDVTRDIAAPSEPVTSHARARARPVRSDTGVVDVDTPEAVVAREAQGREAWHREGVAALRAARQAREAEGAA